MRRTPVNRENVQLNVWFNLGDEAMKKFEEPKQLWSEIRDQFEAAGAEKQSLEKREETKKSQK